MFFFEKKNQKTFNAMAYISQSARDSIKKFFCFFFSKKKRLLSLSDHRDLVAVRLLIIGSLSGELGHAARPGNHPRRPRLPSRQRLGGSHLAARTSRPGSCPMRRIARHRWSRARPCSRAYQPVRRSLQHLSRCSPRSAGDARWRARIPPAAALTPISSPPSSSQPPANRTRRSCAIRQC